MALKTFNPVTPSQRHCVSVSRSHLWKGKPEKTLTHGLAKSGGRNSQGRITARHRGGGHKRRYRHVDFRRSRHDVPAVVERVEYDPNRSAFIALIRYEDGPLSYILAPRGLDLGARVIAAERADIKPGNAMPMCNIPVGSTVHNVEIKRGRGGQLVRSAGASARIVGRDLDKVLLRLTSGEIRRMDGQCFATIGTVSNGDHQNIKIGKAGRNRWLGRRPRVRGVAMNPIDHPHGGGEGKSSGGRHPSTPWGKPTKGKRTRKSKPSDRYIVRRRKK